MVPALPSSSCSAYTPQLRQSETTRCALSETYPTSTSRCSLLPNTVARDSSRPTTYRITSRACTPQQQHSAEAWDGASGRRASRQNTRHLRAIPTCSRRECALIVAFLLSLRLRAVVLPENLVFSVVQDAKKLYGVFFHGQEETIRVDASYC